MRHATVSDRRERPVDQRQVVVSDPARNDGCDNGDRRGKGERETRLAPRRTR